MSTIDQYLRGVAQTDLLTREEEQELLAAVQQKGTDCEEMVILEKTHSRLVASLLLQYLRKARSIMDLVDAGNEGLRKAALQYRPEAGSSFYQFAVPFIREEMQNR